MLLSSFGSGKIEAGLDEAGRGCLAGPVVAASVVFAEGYKNPLLNDSKKLTKADREKLELVVKQDALAWAVAEASVAEIDQINILNASFLAMHRAVEILSVLPQLLLVDGNRFTAYPSIPHVCIVKGDGKYLSIAAASILAKTHRDRLMSGFHQQYPEYAWNTNAGYPTIAHRKAIALVGITPLHRRSFQLLPAQMDIPFTRKS